LSKAVALADRAVRAGGSRSQGAYPAFLFARGLAAFRQGEFTQAIESMRGDASRVLGPAPRLVTAMALHRAGQTAEAKKTLAKAVSTYNWRASAIQDQDGWIIHIIRREAEDTIIPDLNECRLGKFQPRDNSERLVLVAGYQFSERYHEAAKLYRDAFALDQSLAHDLEARHRFNAACMAALAGSGVGVVDKNLADSEKKRWRMQARQWLHDDLFSFGKLLDGYFKQSQDWVRETLKYWQRNSALIGIRDPDKLATLPPDEREDCLALWREVVTMLRRTEKTK
jgi:serine/threonine-protein kinase